MPFHCLFKLSPPHQLTCTVWWFTPSKASNCTGQLKQYYFFNILALTITHYPLALDAWVWQAVIDQTIHNCFDAFQTTFHFGHDTKSIGWTYQIPTNDMLRRCNICGGASASLPYLEQTTAYDCIKIKFISRRLSTRQIVTD